MITVVDVGQAALGAPPSSSSLAAGEVHAGLRPPAHD